LQTTSPEDWAGDKIHPNLEGHGIIALAYLKAIGWDLGA
jgi:hypothetical protein